MFHCTSDMFLHVCLVMVQTEFAAGKTHELQWLLYDSSDATKMWLLCRIIGLHLISCSLQV